MWTPPEALAAAATPAVAMAHPPEEGNAAVEAERKRVGIAADAYAFGMIAWEVSDFYFIFSLELVVYCTRYDSVVTRCVFVPQL